MVISESFVANVHSINLFWSSGLSFLKQNGWLAALIKPQFEVGKGLVGKGGVVRDIKLHEEVINNISHWLEFDMKMNLLGIVESPILGPSGNKEFVITAKK